MESAHILRRLHFVVVIAVAPGEIVEITGFEVVDDGILVERPAVHVGIQAKGVDRAEEEGLALLP